jgi:hypothetical protein
MTGITIEHAQIMEWTQSRGGAPAVDKSSESVCPIIHFASERNGNEVSWEEWMAAFDRGKWAFIYEDRTREGELSRHWKIIPRFAPESAWAPEVKTTSTN